LAQKHIKEMVALASGKAEKKVLIQVAKEVPSSGGADADAAADGGASASKDGDANEAGNVQEEG